MKIPLRHGLLLISLSLSLAKDVDLPICPSNLQYFPQNLPMHCRMPASSDSNQNQGEYPGMQQQFATMPPMPPQQYYQSPPPDKQPQPLPIPIPPYPGMPGSMQIPGGMGPPMPGMPPMPMPMPMVGGPAHKLPVIVMPFYSPDNSFKRPPPVPPHRDHHTKPPRRQKRRDKRRKKLRDSDGDTSSEDTSSGEHSDVSHGSDENGWWRGHNNKKSSKHKAARRFMRRYKAKRKEKKKKDLLTPILQYVTKDGYVIFEKKISKNEAKDWLQPKIDNKGQEPEQVKIEENNVIQVVQKSTEQTSRPEVEEQREAEEKSVEEVADTTTTSAPSPKFHVRKHRQRKVNDLINQPELEP